jgi:hypothetical protein
MHLKPPVTLAKLTAEWLEDAPIDMTEPAKEMGRVPNLHAKYLNILAHHRKEFKAAEIALEHFKSLKSKYYAGDMNSPEDLTKYKLEPWLEKLSRDKIAHFVKADDQVTYAMSETAQHEAIVEVCEKIIKELNNRTWQLKSIIQWIAFTKGTDI